MTFAMAWISGNAGDDAHVSKYGDKDYVRFSLATHRKASGEDVTDWHECIAFGQWAVEKAKTVKKGDVVMVIGRIEYKASKDEHEKSTKVPRIMADKVEVFSVRRSEPVEQQPVEEDLPF